ncbi:arginase [Patiriisocius marinistellae]|uniref:Arginase n=1 Tax=Patiriisocius marinistellae TaxID=2494560 RepID=A0A5J4G0X7_9FLAO|nr:formimidoylglutamase [Patiriisocius marinistellae]GEQ86106.1 arginase [Patiriisocius marinistellae]
MKHLKKITREELASYTSKRAMELKYGEAVAIMEGDKNLKTYPQRYVLVGIPEDIGVRANHGRAGTSNAWESCLKVLCNMQQNERTYAHELLILGSVDCNLEMEAAATIMDIVKLGELVNSIDVKVARVIETIVSAGKIPILIGGGHNNSFGNIKGVSKVLGKAINCLNLDTHSDFRPLEHRHSGNGFSYAKANGFLKNYFVFGLHSNYTSQQMFERMEQENVNFALFEDMFVNGKNSFSKAKHEAEQIICDEPFGLEIDLDAIAMMGSSAMSPVGFTINQIRNFTYNFSKNENCKYIHLCEGAPTFDLHPNQVGKVLAYLIIDVITTTDNV